METPATVVTQAVADRPELQWLRGRLRQLANHYGYPQVTLITHYSDQYRYLSISCAGGTLADQQALMAKLTEPLSPEFRAGNKEACHAYPDSPNPQINFNNFEDAMRWMHRFDGVGAVVTATAKGWARG